MEGGDNKRFHGYRMPAPGSSSSTGDMNSLPADINANNNNNVSNTNNDNVERTVREHERYVPISNVIRIMRKILPSHAKISDGAKETIQECESEFISFITGEANDRCRREQRKTINAEDILWAMKRLGFEDYIDPLALFMNRYRDLEGDRGSKRETQLVNRVVGPHDAGTMVPPFNEPMYGPMPMGGFQYYGGGDLEGDRGSKRETQLVNRVVGPHDAGTMVPPFNEPMYGPMPMGGFLYYGGGNGFYPPMVGYVNEADNPGSSSQAGVENSGQYGHGPQGHGNNF